MKKLFIGLFIAILSFVSIIEIKADSYTTSPQYIGSIDNCYIANSHFYSSSGYNVLIYRIDVTSDYSSVNIPFTFLSGERLRYFTSSELVTTCDINPDFYNFSGMGNGINNSPVIDNVYSYDFYWGGARPDATFPLYVYMYLGSNGSISWGTDISEPEPEPTIPEVTLPTSDYYLFYDFNTIANFNIFSSYDFTSFTDYEKLMFTIVVNIFYLGFIGFCIYILAKGLYKMISWVFR